MSFYVSGRLIKYFLIILILSFTIHLSAAEKTISQSETNQIEMLSVGKFDGNRIDNDLENNGMITSHRISGHSGMEWPQGLSTYTVYASGVWIAGKVNGEIRTVVAEYEPELTPGPFGSDGDEPEHKLYKISANDMAEPLSNPDFQNWPTDYGAPFVDSDGDGAYTPLPDGGDYPQILGDQMLWYVSNDAIESGHSVFATDPLGLEVQNSIWGYDRNDELGDMMYVRSLIINRGENEISDAFVGLWSDPDIGDASDDFVGCDTLLGLGYAYNDGADSQFGTATPAVGYDFLQGPIIPALGETAMAFGRIIPDYKNLKMTSFIKYIGADDIYTDPNDAIEAYFYLQGFRRDGSPFINSATGQPTKFVHPDDPNDNVDATDNIWVDSDDNPSDDRRFLMNAGPFNMAPGDSQEVIYAVMMAQGSDALNSVTRLKEIDESAQLLADNNFIPPPDTSYSDFANAFNPVVTADNLNDNGIANNGEMIKVSFSVENTSLETGSFRVSVRSLSTAVDHVAIEFFDIFDLPPSPISYTIPEGEEPLFYIPSDFAGASVVLQIDINLIGSVQWDRTVLEIPVELVNYIPGPLIHWIQNLEGNTAGEIGIRIINPGDLLNNGYEVTITDQYFDGSGQLQDGPGMNLTNTFTSVILLDRHELPDEYQFGYPITEGFKMIARNPAAGLQGIYQISNGNGTIEEGLSQSPSEDLLWVNFLETMNYPSEQAQRGWFFITHGGGTPGDRESFNARVFRGNNWEHAAGRIFEMRFTQEALENGLGYRRFDDNVIITVPFELWNMGPDAEDQADDFRMVPGVLNAGEASDNRDEFDFWGDDENSGSDNDPSSDWLYWGKSDDETPGQLGYDAVFAAGVGGQVDDTQGWTEVMSRTRLMNWNGYVSHLDSIAVSSLSSGNPTEWGSQDTMQFESHDWFIDPQNSLGHVYVDGDYAYGLVLDNPEVGTIHRWVTNRPLNSSVLGYFNPYDFTTHVDKIMTPDEYRLYQNYPNPFNPTTSLRYQLPLEAHVRLAIFDIKGREIMILTDGVKSQGLHTQIWDGHDSNGHPVSSGMYLYRFETRHFSKTMKMVYLK